LSKQIKIGVASNSINNTVENCLNKLGLLPYLNIFLSNENVQNPKPHPEIYWSVMSKFNTLPENTVIFEDSFVGKLAAKDSGAHLIEIKNRLEKNVDINWTEIGGIMLRKILNENQNNIVQENHSSF
jgi:beta-phosphoglucomutase-like phosphatase (HAD superfamily)